MTITDSGVTTVDQRVPDIVMPDTDTITPRAAAILAITVEAGCTPEKATEFMDFVERSVAQLRQQYPERKPGRHVRHLSVADIDAIHDVMDAVMTDDAPAAPGSAHDLIQTAVLDPTIGEKTLTHVGRNQGYCGVALGVDRS